MPQNRTRKIAVAGILGAVSVLLGITHWGFIPWFGGISLTIMHVPVIIGAILEGPVVGLVIGLIFGLFSLIQAAVAPTAPADVWFINPLLSVLPRLFIGPAAWLAWKALSRWQVAGIIAAGLVGSLTNTILVLTMIGVLGFLPSFEILAGIAVTNGVPEMFVSTVVVLLVMAAWWRINLRKKEGADL